jgi:hypothetical protein
LIAPGIQQIFRPFKPIFFKGFRPITELVNILGRRVPKLPTVLVEIISRVENWFRRCLQHIAQLLYCRY